MAARRVLRRVARRLRGDLSERTALAGLLVLVAVIYVLTSVTPLRPLPIAAQTVPIVLGNLLLELRTLRTLLTTILVAVAASLVELGFDQIRLGSVLVVAVVALVVARTAAQRQQLGVVGVRGDVLIADLRDRLAAGADVPPLPAGWRADVGTRLAGGMTFGGDLIVTDLTRDILQVVLVDISGSGSAAATRALQCSGAFGGLVGAVRPPSFLPAANRYVLRQDWEDGFATAVHVTVDTRTGAYEIRSAGHPPAAIYRATSGAWTLAAAHGPALGLVPAVTYGPEVGVLAVGDVLLVYTDGLVESAGEDLERGIARMVALATGLVGEGLTGGADRLLVAVPDVAGDDRAAVFIWRTDGADPRT